MLGTSRFRFTSLLAVTTIGVYLLVVAGATASIADAVGSCSSWPACSGRLTLSDPGLLVAWGHRIATAVVGLLVVATVLAGLRDANRSRVRYSLGAALALFPVQVLIGAFVATIGPTPVLRYVHLAVGMAIFTLFVLALAWRLEDEYGTDDDAPITAIGESPRPADGADAHRLVDGDEPADGPEPSGPASSAERSAGSGEESAQSAPDSAQSAPESAPSAYSGELGPTDRVRAYLRLMKPRLMWLLCLVAAAGMALAAGPALSARTVAFTLLGGVLSIGASGTFNNVFERDVDRRMSRTADRPVATHRIPARNALAFGGLLTAASLAAFLQVNVLAAALGFAAIVFYSVVYTLLLKPNTVQNTVIGGFAGSLPALIGSAAVTGTIGLPGLLLAGIIFLWTPAHFYNLAMAYKEDYARGGFPMMPVVRGETETRKHVLLYLAATFLAAGALVTVTDLGWLYTVTITVVGGVFLREVVRLHRERTDDAAFRAFHASNAYLGALLVAVVVDALVL